LIKLVEEEFVLGREEIDKRKFDLHQQDGPSREELSRPDPCASSPLIQRHRRSACGEHQDERGDADDVISIVEDRRVTSDERQENDPDKYGCKPTVPAPETGTRGKQREAH